MKIKEMLNTIIDKGKPEDMHKLNEMLNELICDLKEENPELYHEYKKELYELAFGKVIIEEKAKEIVHKMEPYGEHYSMENAEYIKDKYSIRYSTSDVFLVLNSLYNDYHDLLDENDDTYAKMTKLWLNDADSVEYKTYAYFCHIPKKD